jgi:hypothetical protein
MKTLIMQIVPNMHETPTILAKLTTPLPIIWGIAMMIIHRKLVYPSTGDHPGL